MKTKIVVKCNDCKKDITVDLLNNYTLHSKSGNTIAMCIDCYNNIKIIDSEKEIEYVIFNNVRYYNLALWKKLKIKWKDVI